MVENSNDHIPIHFSGDQYGLHFLGLRYMIDKFFGNSIDCSRVRPG